VRIALAAVFGLALAVFAGGCAASQSEGSIGVVLSRDAESRSVFVHDIPEPPPGKEMDAEPPLLPGDELLMVDGSYVRDLSKEELRKKLRGSPGSKLRLTLVRGGQILRIEVARTPLKEGLIRPKEERMAE
jgi:C-terminal processing protease CtpA/Prc